MSTDETIGQARRIAELEELNRLAYALGASLSVEETLGAIADSCLHLTEGERVAILLFGLSPEQEAQTLIRRSDRGEADIDHVVNVLAADLIIRKAEPFTTEDILRSIQLAQPSSTAQRLGPALIYPLTAGERPFGIINLVNSKGGRPFTQEAVRVIGLVARLASQYIQRARLHEALFEDTQRLKEALRDRAGAGSLLGKSPPMKAAREKIALAAGSSATVLLIGETGTGKELAARALHFSGERAEKPFIAVNCAAIPTELFESELFGHEKGAYTGAGSGTRGKFELANNGTLFLDEISSMPPMLQPKLLRVIEEQAFYRIGSEVQTRVNVRIIAATSIDLERAVAEGHFRRELYHRLSVIPIELPPLRAPRWRNIVSKTYHRVRIGPIDNLDELNVTRSRLRAANIDVLRIKLGE